MFLLVMQGAYAQLINDTIKFETFIVEDYAIKNTYKKTVLDSVATKSVENLAQLLQEKSTVFIKTYGSGALASVSFRGTGASHTRVLWNGVALNSPMNGQVDFSLYPTAFFDNVELNYGASGLIDGNGALGGSVNIINQLPEFNNKREIGANYQFSWGSFNKQTHQAKINYLTKNNWFTETTIFHASADNNFTYSNFSKKEAPKETLPNADLKQYGIQQSIYKKLKNNTFGARFWYFNSDRNLPPTMLVSKNDENQKDEAYRALIFLKGFTNKFSYNFTSAIIQEELIYENRLIDTYSKNKSLLIDNHLDIKYHLNKYFNLISKSNIRLEKALADDYSKNPQRFNNSFLLGVSGNYRGFLWTAFNRMTFVDDHQHFVAPSFSLAYHLPKLEEITLKAAAGINYNYPTFNDLYWSPGGNLDLIPEKANMMEAGIKYEKTFNKVHIITEQTAFFSRVDNWIIWQPTFGTIWQPTNLKKVENKGWENTLNISYHKDKITLSAKANYAYTISKNIELPENQSNALDKQLIYVPQNKFNLSGDITYKKSSVGYGWHYTGIRFISTDNNWYLPANYVSNLYFSQQISVKETDLNLRFQILNLFNQTYQSIAWRPMPLRNYLLTLSIKLK